MATHAETFQELVETGSVSHVRFAEQKVDGLLGDRTISQMALDNGETKGKSVLLNVFGISLTEEEADDLAQIYTDAGWRNVMIDRKNTLGLKGTEPGFVFKAEFA